MNKEALTITLHTKRVTFYSRSKQRLWTKGETSGNFLHLVTIATDCDVDSLIITVNPSGKTCHLDQVSCFGEAKFQHFRVITDLQSVIKQRYQQRPENSYVTQLFASGRERLAQKVGEEGVELALASVSGNTENIINETADLLFHVLVLLQAANIEFSEVLTELNHRAQ